MRRRGFTLIELMIVIVIIALLIALLTPAIMGAMRQARIGEVRQEISQLEYAIADFNANFGVNPPSYFDFRLHNKNADGSYTPSLTGTTLLPATQATLRRLWPNIDMGRLITDLSTNPTKQKILDGPQCLVFFLGGLVPAAGEVPVGFSNNPRAPLSPGGKRIGPFFEFRLDRLYDANPGATFDGYEGYLDTLPGQQKPYFYITSDRYSTQDAANASATDATLMRPVYRQSAKSYFNSGKYQIVSPGADGVDGQYDTLPGGAYGIGGLYDADAGTVDDSLPGTNPYSGQAKGDADNITNFASGTLGG